MRSRASIRGTLGLILALAGRAAADVPVMVLAFHRPDVPEELQARETVRQEATLTLPAVRPERSLETDQILAEIEGILRRHHPDGERLPRRAYRSAREIFEALGDPETAYAPIAEPRRLTEVETEHCVFGWFGFNMVGRGGGAVIISTVEGRAGARAGLRPGDQVLAVQGREARGHSPTEICGWVLNARANEHLSLTVQQPGEAPREIDLFRIVPSTPVEPISMLRPDGVLVLRIPSLDAGMGAKVQAALAAATAASRYIPLHAIVIDLRECPGGQLSELVAVSRSLIAAPGPLVHVQWKGREIAYNNLPATATQLPIAVLVGPGTSGGAEHLAAALRDQGQARLVGTPTFGKSSVQRDIPLSNGHSLRLTVGRMTTARGERIDTGGLEPDRVETATVSAADRQAMNPARDPVLASALELLAGR